MIQGAKVRLAVAAAFGLAGCGPTEVQQQPKVGVSGRMKESPRARSIVDRALGRFQVQEPDLQPPGAVKGERPQPKKRAALPPGVAVGFDRDGKSIRSQLAPQHRRGPKGAQLTLAAAPNEAFQLKGATNAIAVDITLAGASAAEPEVAGGYLVYAGAHASGADLLRRPSAEGLEDFFSFESAPATPSVTYTMNLGPGVAGLRLVANTLELLDRSGDPGLRSPTPYLFASDGQRHEAQLTVEGCTVDTSPVAPWGRAPTPPGARTCTVRVSWNPAVTYPILLDPSWTSTDFLDIARQDHSATLLATGQVLIVGGTNGGPSAENTAELFDPSGNGGVGDFSPTFSLTTGGRYRHAAVKLNDGRVLITGGSSNFTPTILDKADIFTLGTGWASAPAMSSPRYYHTATLLANNSVLVVGGVASNGTTTVAAADLYNATASSRASGGTFPAGTARSCHTATLIHGTGPSANKVLIAGGNDATFTFHKDALLWDTSGTFTPVTDAMEQKRILHTASEFDSGGQKRILIAGGGTEGNATGGIASTTAEIFNPDTLQFDPVATAIPNPHSYHQAVVLKHNKVLLTGSVGSAIAGNQVSDIYDPASGSPWKVGGPLLDARGGLHSMTLLASGRVLIAGGNSITGALDSAEIFDGCGACDDGNGCTCDGCNPLVGCQHPLVASTGNPGTTDAACTIARAGVCPVTDSDGDGFSDAWEDNGFIDYNCNGIPDAGDFTFPSRAPHVFSAVTKGGTGGGTGQILPTVTDPNAVIAASTIVVTIAADGGIGGTTPATFTFTVNGGAPSAPAKVLPIVDITGNLRLLFYIPNFRAGDTYTYTTSMGASAPVADRNIPNLYVQYDYMGIGTPGAACSFDADCSTATQPNEVCRGGFCNHDHAPSDPLHRLVVDRFKAHNIRLYIDPVHNAVPHSTVVTFAKPTDTDGGQAALCAGALVTTGVSNPDAVSLFQIKSRSVTLGFGAPFDPARKPVFRYAVFGHFATCLTDNPLATLGNCTQCPFDRAVPRGAPRSGASGRSELPGNDFIISLGDTINNALQSTPRNPFVEDGVFMHEFGHTIGLHHYGDIAEPPGNPPNYLSVMNGKYVFSGIQDTGSIGGTAAVENLRRLDYSTHTLRTLSEANLDESLGTSSTSTPGFTNLVRFTNTHAAPFNNGSGPEVGAIDWDGDPNTTCTGPANCPALPNVCTTGGECAVQVDLNESGPPPNETMRGYADWGSTCAVSATECSGDFPTCDAVTKICFKTCTSSADCRLNQIRAQIRATVDPTLDPREPCVSGRCVPFIYSFQCFQWGMADAPPPLRLQSFGEPTPRAAIASHDFYPLLPVAVDVRPGCAENWLVVKDPTTVPVAVLGSKAFDVNQIEKTSVAVNGAPGTGATIADVNGDHFPDFTALFPMNKLRLAPTSKTVTVGGWLKSSQLFSGTSKVKIVAGSGPEVTPRPAGPGGFAASLWPPNGKQEPFSLDRCVLRVTDRCGKPLAMTTGTIVKVQSDEPDPSTPPDDMVIGPPSTVKLRRERDGTGDGRVYTIHYRFSDPTGGATDGTCKVEVRKAPPHPAIDSGVKVCVGSCP